MHKVNRKGHNLYGRRDFLWTVGSMSSMALLGGVSFALDDKKLAAQTKSAN